MVEIRSVSKILLVEDERNVGSTLTERLSKEGFEVNWAMSVAEAKEELKGSAFDLCVLDIQLPDGSGFEVARLVREEYRSTSIVFLTAFGEADQRVKGLELGAEDYVVKPFHLKELILRIKNSLKRSAYLRQSTGPVRLGRAVIYFSRYEVEREGKLQPLSQKECALLKLLVDRRGQVVSRDEILDEVWSKSEFPTSRTIDNFIMRLRRMIEDDPETPLVIRSVRGVGYQITED